MLPVGRLLAVAGVVLLLLGLGVMLSQRLNLPLGRLPGDMNWRGRNWRVSVPLGTSLLLSLLLTLLLWIASRFFR